jgi:hypothetical protein
MWDLMWRIYYWFDILTFEINSHFSSHTLVLLHTLWFKVWNLASQFEISLLFIWSLLLRLLSIKVKLIVISSMTLCPYAFSSSKSCCGCGLVGWFVYIDPFRLIMSLEPSGIGLSVIVRLLSVWPYLCIIFITSIRIFLLSNVCTHFLNLWSGREVEVNLSRFVVLLLWVGASSS